MSATGTTGSALVTGAAGFIGSHLCQALLAQGWQVCGLDLGTWPLPAHPRLEWIQGDICDPALWQQVPPSRSVFHLAACTGVRASLTNAPHYLRINIEGTARVLDWAVAENVAEFLLASSSSVYGDCEAPAAEDRPCQPRSPYAASKAGAELLLQSYAQLYPLRTVALRFFTVYGPRQRRDMALYRFAAKLLRGEPLPLFEPQGTWRDLSYCGDIVAGLLAAREWLQARSAGSYACFNLGSGSSVRLDDLVSRLIRVSGLEAPKLQLLARPQADAPRTWADIGRAQALLGYAPAMPLDQGLGAFWDWFSQQA
ncbi:MAG: NAD-dependent epimerase/dehydratase family protein [Candidatus Sericytochromatia bacterium]